MTTAVIVDSGGANLASVQFAFERLGLKPQVTTDPAVIKNASHVILPGVGAAKPVMELLQARGLIPVLKSLTQPVLGFCLGMQILFTGSEEGGLRQAAASPTDRPSLVPVPCLGLIDGTVKQIRSSLTLPVPHMGWNTLKITKQIPLLDGIPDGTHMYFVHSFAAPVLETTAASCTYGHPFTAVTAHKNVMGCQFHPERSGDAGARILKNFVGLS
jgi:imidazole glycerol-phosphate synthase subunit HisH